MTRWVSVLFLSFSMLAPAGHALEIRVAPPDRVFLNDSGRRVGIRDIMLQNIAVLNDSEDEVELQRMEITAFRYGLNRQRNVYAVVAQEMAGPVHAFSVRTYTPEEWAKIKDDHTMKSPDCKGGSAD